MNIKKITLLTAACLSAVTGVFLLNDSAKEQYFPRAGNSLQQPEGAHAGYVEYMESIRNNRTTGSISTQEVNEALEQASKMRKGNKALNLSWNFKGPDNVGGRTRAIVIDNQNVDHIYAGSVSGGIWESFDAGLSWSAYDNNFKIQNVSAMAQASNGDVFVATGPHFDGAATAKSVRSEFVGNGIWKLTGNGNSDLLVGPSTEFNPNNEWATTCEIAVDPNNSSRIFVGMNRGLRESTDGGLTWTNPIPTVSAVCQDVHITADGKIAATYAGSIRVSLDNGVTWNTSTFPTGRSRIEMAIAPSNSNIMYATNTTSSICTEVYRSIDAGLTWQKLLNTQNFLANSVSCQGFYDNTIAVFPNDPGRIVVGGVSLFQWRQSSVDPAPVQGEWRILATTNEINNNTGSRNLNYVHADKHFLLFHPLDSNTLFIGSDGGIGVTNNVNDLNPTYGQFNLGYNVTQFYDIGVGPKDLVMGGTQDNGTKLVGFKFNTGKSAVSTFPGDGFDTELFTINSELGIASLFFGEIFRIQGIREDLSSSTIDPAPIYSGLLSALCGDESLGCSQVFYTAVAKWESFNHTETKDSVLIREEKRSLPPVAANTVVQYKSKNNNHPLQDTVRTNTFPADTSTINPITPADTLSIAIDSNLRVVTFINAFDTITVNEDSMTIEFRYREKTAETKPFTYGVRVDYNNIFHNELSTVLPPRLPLSITVKRDVIRNLSTVVYIDPKVEFNYEFEFPDLVQSTVAVFNIRGVLPTDVINRHVYISKDVLKGSEVTEPRWLRVADNSSMPNATPNSQNTISSAFSNDGDKLFYGTTSGDLYRIDNLNDIDLSQIDVSLPTSHVVDNITTHTKIAIFGNRAVTGIAVDPQNDDNVIVTLGNYGSLQYVQRSTNATAASGVQFTQISGAGTSKLPNSPVYEAVIDFQDNNKVIIGTELGVFATDNAFTTATTIDNGQTVIDVQWTEENTGLGRAPVMSVKQMTFGWAEGAINQGKVYLGTHGRGIYETSQLVGLSDNGLDASEKKVSKNSLIIYPNPAISELTVELNVKANSAVNVQIFNLNGQLVKEVQPTNITNIKNNVSINVEDLKKGTYIVRTVTNGSIATGKFIKQ